MISSAKHALGIAATVLATTAMAPSALAQSSSGSQSACGEVVTLATRGAITTRYSFAGPSQGRKDVLVLLPGGDGVLDLDAAGCPRRLAGNFLVRVLRLFHEQGFVTVLVDAPPDHRGEDGLAGFRLAAEHARDIGTVIADLRRRTKLPVWLVGTSRGTISAASAAAMLAGDEAPDGLVLTSPLTSGHAGGRKAWVSQTVFQVPLEAIRMPVLVVGHAADTCIRTPPALMADITARTNGAREQVVTVTGGPGSGRAQPDVAACVGRSAHGFLQQEAEVVAGIARFINGGRY